MQHNVWFVGVGTEKTEGTTFVNVRSFPAELWKNPKRFDYVPKKVLATYMDVEPNAKAKDSYPKMRLIHLFTREEGAMLDAIVQNALAFGGENADLNVYDMLERLVGCGLLALDPKRFPPIMLGVSPLLE